MHGDQNYGTHISLVDLILSHCHFTAVEALIFFPLKILVRDAWVSVLGANHGMIAWVELEGDNVARTRIDAVRSIDVVLLPNKYCVDGSFVLGRSGNCAVDSTCRTIHSLLGRQRLNVK